MKKIFLAVIVTLVIINLVRADDRLDKAVQIALDRGRHDALAKDGLVIRVSFVPVTQLNKNEMLVNGQPSAFTPAPAATRSVITRSQPMMTAQPMMSRARACST